jgi:tRNA pseudouridine38-40 synthase
VSNYKLIIQYDGTDYTGWQTQSGTRTIQQTITDSIEVIIKERVNLIGSGRTDTGVHAIGQTANFRTETDIDIYKFKHSLNSVLPFDISVTQMEKTGQEFHARFDARKRTYIYILSKHKSPFFRKYAYHYYENLSIELLNSISKIFIGSQDYSSFCRKNEEVDNKICEIYDAKWYEKDELTIFEISANRFLHGMVRTITGTILKATKMNNSINYIEKVFSEKSREAAPMAVPAHGLFLFKVEY